MTRKSDDGHQYRLMQEGKSPFRQCPQCGKGARVNFRAQLITCPSCGWSANLNAEPRLRRPAKLRPALAPSPRSALAAKAAAQRALLQPQILEVHPPGASFRKIVDGLAGPGPAAKKRKKKGGRKGR